MRHAPLLALVCLALAALRPASAQPVLSCDAAAAQAELTHELPAGLLRAIGRVESGRRDPATGQLTPWPWAINAEGKGRLFDSALDAIAAARALRDNGVPSIDVGCFQVNLLHHPAAFATLEDGFDPARNADYAARFLRTLRNRTGTWNDAVAAYHSATPERGNPYRDRVLAAWSRDETLPPNSAVTPPAATPPAATPVPLVVRATTWSPPTTPGLRVWTPSRPGQGAAVIALLPRAR